MKPAPCTKQPKQNNSAVPEFDRAAADAERKANIRLRYTRGQYVSRTEKQFAGMDDDPIHQNGTVRGYGGVIEHIRQHHGITLSKTTLSSWSHGRSLPQGCTEPFPPCEPPDRHRISTFMP